MVLGACELSAGARECTPRTILLYLEVAHFEPELRECTSRTTFVRFYSSCDCAAGAAGVHFVQTSLAGAPEMLFAYYLVPSSCEFQAGAAEAPDLRRRFAELKTHSHGATAGALGHAQEGSPSSRHNFDTHDRRRRFGELKTHSPRAVKGKKPNEHLQRWGGTRKTMKKLWFPVSTTPKPPHEASPAQLYFLWSWGNHLVLSFSICF